MTVIRAAESETESARPSPSPRAQHPPLSRISGTGDTDVDSMLLDADTSLTARAPAALHSYLAVIKIVGVGGGGVNARLKVDPLVVRFPRLMTPGLGRGRGL